MKIPFRNKGDLNILKEDDLMIKIAHRGLSMYYPENTLIAYKKAYEKGIINVECDISFTKDNVPVLLHDNQINRTSNKKGKTNKYTIEELKKLDFGSWFDIKFKDEKIPTLKEFLELCKELSLIPYIEIKPIKNKKLIKKYCKIIIDIVNDIDYHNIVFISFSLDILKEINFYYQYRLGLITKKLKKNLLNKFIKIRNNTSNLFIYHYNKKIDDKIINLCKDNNIELEVWTIENKNDLLNINPYISRVTCNYIEEE